MSTNEEIKRRMNDMEKYLFYLIKSMHKYLTARKELSDGTSRFQNDYNLKLDDFPFFSMYVNTKKAIYEQFLLAAQENGELNESARDALAEAGLLSKKGKFAPKSLKNLEYENKEEAKQAGSILNYDDFEEYLDGMELALLYVKPYSDVILNIYNHFAPKTAALLNEQRENPYEDIFYFDDEEEKVCVDENELYDLKTGNGWASDLLTSGNGFPYDDEMARAYFESKEIDYTPPTPKEDVFCTGEMEEYIKSDRKILLKVTNKRQYERICDIFRQVIGVLTAPESPISEEIVVAILDQALAGVRRVVFIKQLDQYATGKSRLFSRDQLRVALNASNQKFSQMTGLYGEKTFTEEEIKLALEALGQPTTLFDI